MQAMKKPLQFSPRSAEPAGMQSSLAPAGRDAPCRVPEGSLRPFMGQAEGPGALDAIQRKRERLAACKTLEANDGCEVPVLSPSCGATH